jgi:carotenoid cleavage dioxygenase-like enzyme
VVAERQLDDRAVAFPRIDDRLATLLARYAVSVGDGRPGPL